MADRYTATVLLNKRWEFDPDELARLLSERFPEIGQLSGRMDTTDPTRVKLSVDGADVEIRHRDTQATDAPSPDGADLMGLKPSRDADPSGPLTSHIACLELRCGGYGDGLDWMKAYATIVTLVAGALARLGPTAGVLFPASGIVVGPDEAYRAGRTALRGVSPIETWIAFYPFQPENRTEGPANGAFTRGLAPFIGREIEMAPSDIDARTALTRLQGAVWQALDAEHEFLDGSVLGDPLSPGRARVRLADAWLRPQVPAIVLVGVDSFVEPETLTLRPKAASAKQLLPNFPEIPRIDAVFERMDLSFSGLSRLLGWAKTRALPVVRPLAGKALRLAGAVWAQAVIFARKAYPIIVSKVRLLHDMAMALIRNRGPKRVGD